MVSRLIALLILLLLATSVQAKRIKIYPAEPMLGQAVTLSMPADIEFIERRFNWAALEKCFAVARADYGSERVRFTLYPYGVGPCEIKREKWETWEVPSHFNVRPNPDVKVSWGVPKNTVFAREAIIWRAQVQLAQASGYSAWMEAPGKGAVEYRFSPLQDGLLSAAGWLERAGTRTLYSPLVAVKNPGGQIWRFPAPSQVVTVRPLPVYLPADIVVGRLQWQPVDMPKVWPRSELMPLQLALVGENINPDWLPALDDILPPLDRARWLVGDKQIRTFWRNGILYTEVRLDQPLQFSHLGLVNPGHVQMMFFDPVSRKLQKTRLSFHSVWVLPSFLIWIGKILFWSAVILTGLLLVVVVWKLGWLVWLLLILRLERTPPEQQWRAIRLFHKMTENPFRPFPDLTPTKWLNLQPRWLRPLLEKPVSHLQTALFR